MTLKAKGRRRARRKAEREEVTTRGRLSLELPPGTQVAMSAAPKPLVCVAPGFHGRLETTGTNPGGPALVGVDFDWPFFPDAEER